MTTTTPISTFVTRIQTIHNSGQATEHSYRSAIEQLFHRLDPKLTALNEPKRVACGAPDFIIQRGDITSTTPPKLPGTSTSAATNRHKNGSKTAKVGR